jgi:hypothetical protein
MSLVPLPTFFPLGLNFMHCGFTIYRGFQGRNSHEQQEYAVQLF